MFDKVPVPERDAKGEVRGDVGDKVPHEHQRHGRASVQRQGDAHLRHAARYHRYLQLTILHPDMVLSYSPAPRPSSFVRYDHVWRPTLRM